MVDGHKKKREKQRKKEKKKEKKEKRLFSYVYMGFSWRRELT